MKIGLAPKYLTALMGDTNEMVGTITSESLFTLLRINEICKPIVPFKTGMTYFEFVIFLIFRSRIFKYFPLFDTFK